MRAMDVTVIVATYGDLAVWEPLADRAMRSAAACEPAAMIRLHGDSLAGARNEAAAMAVTEWLVYLDADDELEPGYFDAMSTGEADLRAPSVRYVTRPGRTSERARMPRVAGHTHDCAAACLAYGNWCCVGTMVPTALALQVGGFDEWPMFEDWAFFVKCWQAGATVEAAPAAVYRAFVRRDSRNRGPSQAAKLAAHQAIASSLGLPVPA